MQGYCDVYKWTILKRTSPEVKCLHPTSSRREMCTLSVSNVIYHKLSHGAAFYTLNGKNVNVMLEFVLTQILQKATWTFIHQRHTTDTREVIISMSVYCVVVCMFCVKLLPVELKKYLLKDWLVGYFGFNGLLRQYFSLYRAVSQRHGQREETR